MGTQKSERNNDNFIMLPTVDFCILDFFISLRTRNAAGKSSFVMRNQASSTQT